MKIRQSMLHIAKARRLARALQLRIVDHKLGLRLACGHSKDRRRFQQPIRHRVGKVSTFYPSQRSADRIWVQQIPLDNFRAKFPQSIGPCIQPMNEGTNRNALFQQKCCDSASCGALGSAAAPVTSIGSDIVLLLHEMSF
jgi:hypothetical protein